MSESVSNPCAACSIHQDCCRHLTGLRLTEIEFDRCFARHATALVIEREGPLYVVSQRGGEACPNWHDGGCSVYDDRPRECRLFPFTMYSDVKADSSVTLRVHSDTRCPLKSDLLGDRELALQLVRRFAEEAYGGAPAAHVRHERRIERILRLYRQLAHRVTRIFIGK